MYCSSCSSCSSSSSYYYYYVRCVVVPSFWLGGMHDVLWVLTYPYAHFDVLMTKTMRWFMYLSKRLSASFLGQSYNPLRHRWNMVIWNVDQVLVTTFFFTLVVCLYPTLMVYFLFFKWFTYSRQLVLLSLRHTLHGLHYVPFYTTFLDMSSASFKKEWIHPSLFTPATSSSFQSTVDLQLIQKNIHEPWTIQFRPLTLFERLRPSTW
ncbi:hypothetical protein HMI55_002457 [Coelomomyces lativittatus]|nr:hypothetical protein HMI55_002457 [Coelomomyces lativittatus]